MYNNILIYYKYIFILGILGIHITNYFNIYSFYYYSNTKLVHYTIIHNT